MAYLCFIEFALHTAPHREALLAGTLEDAILEAQALLDQQGSAYEAHIYQGDERVASVRRREWRPGAGHPPQSVARGGD